MPPLGDEELTPEEGAALEEWLANPPTKPARPSRPVRVVERPAWLTRGGEGHTYDVVVSQS